MRLLSQKQIPKNIQLPGDKSISHRCLILASLAHGTSIFENLSRGGDVRSTQKILQQLGVKIEESLNHVQVVGTGLHYPGSTQELDCENAGTLMRIMTGVLCGQKFTSTLVGDSSLMSRPMDRVADPLRTLGAMIQLHNNKAPITISPSVLSGGLLNLESPSAQVKSALMFASLYCQQPLILNLKHKTRDHTEKLFPFFNIPIEMVENTLRLNPQPDVKPVSYKIPCDPSAAAFWIVASLISQQSVNLKSLCLNPTRLGTIHTLQKLGIQIDLSIEEQTPELVGSLTIHAKEFDGFEIMEDQLPSLIDEIPVLAILATQARTESVIHNARELRVKETDRIQTTQKMFESLGLKISIVGDTLRIPGQQVIQGGVVDSFKDHRIAMAAAIASFASRGSIEILDSESAYVSDPHFWGHFL